MLDFIHLEDLFNALGLLLKTGCNENYSGDLSRQTDSFYSFIFNLFINFVGFVQSRLFQVQALGHVLDSFHTLCNLFIFST